MTTMGQVPDRPGLFPGSGGISSKKKEALFFEKKSKKSFALKAQAHPGR
jgi:hypothetical protein